MRWKFVIPFTILLSIFIIFNIFFLDYILKRAIVSTGEMIFGAKVEIEYLKTKFKNLSINIKNLKVADKNDPWKNLFELGNVSFAIKPLPLLSKKFIIEEMTLKDVRWGTKRQTSGALPPKKEKKIKKIKSSQEQNTLTNKVLNLIKEKGKSELQALPSVVAIKKAQDEIKNLSINNIINSVNLESLKEIQIMKDDISKKYLSYQNQINELKIQEKLNKISDAIEQNKDINIKDIKDIEIAKQKIDNLNQLRLDLEKTITNIQNLKSQFITDFGEQKEILTRLNEIKNKDYQSILEKLKIPSLSFQNITKAIFGPIWVDRVEKILYYVNIIKTALPERKTEEKVVKQERYKGMDIIFPIEGMLPTLLIKKIYITAYSDDINNKSKSLEFKGSIADITSDQVLVGRPTLLKLEALQDTRQININGIFDHTKDEKIDTITFLYKGIPAKDLGLPSNEYLPSFENGNASFNATVEIKQGLINAGLHLDIEGLTIKSTPEPKSKELYNVQEILNKIWKDINKISLDATFISTPDNISVSITSNLDKILSERLKNILGESIIELQSKIRNEIDKITQAKKEELLKEFNSKKEEVLNQFREIQKQILEKLSFTDSQIKNFQNKIQDVTEAEKKKTEQEIRKKAEEQLKGIFR